MPVLLQLKVLGLKPAPASTKVLASTVRLAGRVMSKVLPCELSLWVSSTVTVRSLYWLTNRAEGRTVTLLMMPAAGVKDRPEVREAKVSPLESWINSLNEEVGLVVAGF